MLTGVARGENPAIWLIVAIHIVLALCETIRRSSRTVDPSGSYGITFSKTSPDQADVKGMLKMTAQHPVIVRRSFITAVYSFGCTFILALSMALLGQIDVSTLGIVGLGFLFTNFFRMLGRRPFAKLEDFTVEGGNKPAATMSDYGPFTYVLRALAQVFLIVAAFLYFQFSINQYGKTAATLGFVVLLLGLILLTVIIWLRTDMLSKSDHYVTGEAYVAFSRLEFTFYLIVTVFAVCVHAVAFLGDYHKLYAASGAIFSLLPMVTFAFEIINCAGAFKSKKSETVNVGAVIAFNVILCLLTALSLLFLSSATCEFMGTGVGGAGPYECYGFQSWIADSNNSRFLKLFMYVGPASLCLILMGLGEITSAMRPGMAFDVKPQDAEGGGASWRSVGSDSDAVDSRAHGLYGVGERVREGTMATMNRFRRPQAAGGPK